MRSVDHWCFCHLREVLLQEVGLADFDLSENVHAPDPHLRAHRVEVQCHITEEVIEQLSVVHFQPPEMLQDLDQLAESQFPMVVRVLDRQLSKDRSVSLPEPKHELRLQCLNTLVVHFLIQCGCIRP
jgi:hypothetical protein